MREGGGAENGRSVNWVLMRPMLRAISSRGQGLPTVFPPIKGRAVVTASDPTEHIRTVMGGPTGKTIGGVANAAAMPAFADQLTHEEQAAVLSYERTSGGNQAPPVKPEDVVARR